MQHHRKLRGAVLVTAAALLLSSCSGVSVPELKDTLTPARTVALGEEFLPLFGDPLAFHNDWTLTVEENPLSLTVTDTATGTMWTTNPNNIFEDSLASVDMADQMKAQFVLEYYDANGSKHSMNSFTDCADKEQYTFREIPDGVAIVYRLGDEGASEDQMIQKISSARFEEKVLSRLSDGEREEMEGYYRYYEEEGLWIVSSRGRNNFERVLELMARAGYTEDDLVYDNTQNGIAVTRTQRVSFSVTVLYRLTDEGLQVEVPLSELQATEGYTIHNLQMLPTFGALDSKADEEKDDFVLVPDGSGGLLKADSAQNPENYYSESIYGQNRVVRSGSDKTHTQDIALPVFGLSNGQSGFLANVSEGAANARIEAYRSGRYNDYMAAYADFTVYDMDFVLLSGATLASGVPTFQKEAYRGSYSIDYLLLPRCSGYEEMAAAYRSYLKARDLFPTGGTADSLPFYLEALCGVYGYKSFAGIAYTGVKPATTFEQLQTMAGALEKSGVRNLQIKAIGWFNDGIKHSYPSRVSVEGGLGGKSGLQELIEACRRDGIGLYPDVDLLTTYVGKNGFSSTGDSAKTLDTHTAEIEDLSYATLYGRETASVKPNSAYVIAARLLPSLTDGFLKGYAPYAGAGLSLRTVGSRLYADYTSDATFDRETYRLLVEQQLKKLQNAADGLMINTGHLYAVPYARHVVNLPLSGSWLLCVDETVPFYEMVFRDAVNLGSEALNLSDDWEESLLRCADFGVAPLFQLCYADSAVLNDTELYSNYAAGFAGWEENAAEAYRRLAAVLDEVQGQPMLSRRTVAEDTVCVTYQNGTRIYVNYADRDVTVDGLTVPARSFVRGGTPQ